MKVPFLKNFRRGFATNSSSSHSFVYLKGESPLGPENPSSYLDSEFGWGDFRLSTIREKLFYVLVGRIGGSWGAGESTDELFDKHEQDFPELTKDDFEAAKDGYIDHQSHGTISVEEARDPHVVVFGGNDNSGYSQERAAVISAKEVDWSKTRVDWEDEEYIQPDDAAGQAALKKAQANGPYW